MLLGLFPQRFALPADLADQIGRATFGSGGQQAAQLLAHVLGQLDGRSRLLPQQPDGSDVPAEDVQPGQQLLFRPGRQMLLDQAIQFPAQHLGLGCRAWPAFRLVEVGFQRLEASQRLVGDLHRDHLAQGPVQHGRLLLQPGAQLLDLLAQLAQLLIALRGGLVTAPEDQAQARQAQDH